MSDADLEEIRRARMQQLQQEQGGDREGGSGGAGGRGGEQEEKRQREAEARSNILNQILESSAADRLNRIRLVKEERATQVENRLIMLAQSGQLRQKVSEAQLKDILSAVAEQAEQQEQSRITISRRKGWDDDDDLLDGL